MHTKIKKFLANLQIQESINTRMSREIFSSPTANIYVESTEIHLQNLKESTT